jgi:cytochrome c oxidase assembly protein subunit 15
VRPGEWPGRGCGTYDDVLVRSPTVSPAAFRMRRVAAQGLARLPSVSPVAFRRIALVAAICYALLVVTGGAVRLTGSGLGCLDWPTCSKASVTPAVSFHPLVEFSNRMVSVAVTVLSIATFLAALTPRIRRRDIVWLSAGLVGGIIGQIVIGGIVVLTKLNPYWVSLHFVLTLAVLADGIVLYQRSGRESGAKELLVGRDMLWLSRLLLTTISVLVLAGTMVTGSGPHAGGVGAIRVPIAFRDMAELHADIALFLIGMTLATLFALHQAKAPTLVQRRARTALEILFLQGTLGYTQYFLHDNALVVEFHLAGATAAWSAVVVFYLALYRRPEMEPRPQPVTVAPREADRRRRRVAVNAPA